MPWLTSTAFLHSAILEERRDLFKRWNYVLILLTFCLVILGTFLTRSGVLSSVHAFAQSSIGPVFFVLIGLVLIASVGLLLWRWNQLNGVGELHSLFSRESIFLFNNILFICLFLICLTGVLFPILSEIVTGQQVTVGAQWYKSTTGPLFALLLLLMGVVPLSVWGASTARELGKSLWKPAAFSLIIPLVLILLGVRSLGGILVFWLAGLVASVLVFDLQRTTRARSRALQEPFLTALLHLVRGNHRRYGGYLVHIGVVLMAVGIVGIEFFQTQTQVTLDKTTPVTFANFSLQFTDLASVTSGNGLKSTAATLTVRRPDGTTFTLTPRVDLYPTDQQAVTVPGEYSTLAGDLYVVLVDWQPLSTTGATFRIYYNPLIDWFWIGAIVLVLGGLFAFSPARRTEKPKAAAA
jgi:cytochrome c-type biogenesis protein CcmF